MNNNFESTYFRSDKNQVKGPQDRCHEWSDLNSHEFFGAVDGKYKNEYLSYTDSATFLKAYDPVPEEERSFFEQTREGQGCKEYYDIDWALASAADQGEIKRLEQQVFAAFLRARNQHAPELALDEQRCRVLSASNSKKMSLHIVIPKLVFQNNHQHLKAFVLAFQQFWCSALCDKDDAVFLDHIYDGVYSRNRIMRILGSHPSRPLRRVTWHPPSMAAKDEEFLITSVEF